MTISHSPPSLDHLIAMSDDVGIAQHAIFDVPNRAEGYCTDDVSRAFMVALSASAFGAQRVAALELAQTYLAFLVHAQRPDGWSHNFMSYGREWLDESGTPDSNGRAVWAFGFGVRFAPNVGWRAICRERLERALPIVRDLSDARALSYAALGIAHAQTALGAEASGMLDPVLHTIGEKLAAYYARNARLDWDWFEDGLTYDNARLCEASLRIGLCTGDAENVELGLTTLRFYESIVVRDGILVPIGNDGWYRRGGPRALYGQQPLEAVAMIDAVLAAFDATGDSRFRRLADLSFGWFEGRNTLDARLVRGGGCCDGLEASGPNANMGAESTLAYLSAAYALSQASPGLVRLVR